MESLWIGLGSGLIVGFLAGFFYWYIRAGGKQSLDLAMKITRKAQTEPQTAEKLRLLLDPPPPPKPTAEAVRLLGLLQREARLLDFLMENLAPFSDEQIGASVREIQLKSQSTLKKYLLIEPVLPNQEGTQVTVPSGFDPSAIRLVGNVTGNPPFRGLLQHAGWRAKTINVPKPAPEIDDFVLMPAEVELG